MTQTTYITGVTTLEELKREYKRLALLHHPDIGGDTETMLHHPDLGGDTETMKDINNEYDALFEKLKHTHKNKAGEYYTKENTTETAGAWREGIEKLIRLHMTYREWAKLTYEQQRAYYMAYIKRLTAYTVNR